MSYMRGDLLTKARKLVKGPRQARAHMAQGHGTGARSDVPACVKRFFKRHPDSLYHDAIKISGFDPPPARVFAWRLLELKEQGVSEDDAMAVADYRTEKKAKKKVYKELKEIARGEGKRPPLNPYPSAVKEIQAEEEKYVNDRLYNPKIIEIAKRMKEERAVLS